MSIAFLSHSSSDKKYVRYIADTLGSDRCVFDEYCFEAGMKNFEEILRGLQKTDIFVIFISKNSLKSDWVQRELFIAHEHHLYSDSRIKQILPIIIDYDVNYKTEEIPSFLRQGFGSYNLKYIESNKIAYRIIKKHLNRLCMDSNPQMEKEQNFFWGKETFLKEFRMRFDDLSKPAIKCVVLSGFEGMGRASFMRNSLIEVGCIEKYYFPPSIYMSKDDGIDDFIVKMYEQGFGDIDITTLIAMSMKQKIDLAVIGIKSIQHHQEYLLVYDDACIINREQSIANWLIQILQNVGNKFCLCIATIATPNDFAYRNNHDVFHINVTELDQIERIGFFREFARLKGLEIEREDINFFKESLTGYPPQIHDTVNLINKNGLAYIKKNPHLIVEFSSTKASAILQHIYDLFNDNEKLVIEGFLAFLVQFDGVPMDMVYDVTNLNSNYDIYYTTLATYCVCRYVGAASETLRLSDTIKDYVSRSRYCMNTNISEYLTNRVNDFNSQIDSGQFNDELGFDELSFYIKSNLKNNKNVPDHFLFPSILVKTIIDLYNSKKYDRLVEIYYSYSQNNRFEYFEKGILFQIKLYLCQSLAKKQDNRFYDEVEYFAFGSEVREFLFGFYKRNIGDYNKAIEIYQKILDNNDKHIKARREIVISFLRIDEYDKALNHAEDNYTKHSDNPYMIHAYFECLIHQPLTDLRQKIINSLIDEMGVFKARYDDMYFQMIALKYAIIDNDVNTAISVLEQAIKKSDNPIYLIRTIFDLYEKEHDLPKMKETLDKIEEYVSDGRSSFQPFLVRRRALYDAYNGKPIQTIEAEINRHNMMSSSAKESLIKRVHSITPIH